MTRNVIFSGKKLLVLERDEWQYAERVKGKEVVAVLAVADDGTLILIEQYRPPVDARVIDLPAGLVGDENENDDPTAAARKELEEETGYVCDSVERLIKGPTSPGITSEMVTFFRARGVRRVGKGGGVGSESITVHTVPLSEIEPWLRRKEREGVMVDLKIWTGLHFLAQST